MSFTAVEGPSPIDPGSDTPQDGVSHTLPDVTVLNTGYGRIMTGDGRRPLLWGGILGASLLALGLWNRKKRRRRRKIV